MNQTLRRVQAPSPKFFVNLRWIVGAVGAVATAANAAWDLPAPIGNILEFVGYLSGGSFLTTFLPKK